ncbi:MAG: bifunctional 3-deoxy-7-phosphoheptulonate synthase/chorismate mutase type II [FCB group bacterium]|nr:bifunctional 3-deoxy-7-phosphoheptulonate synthase/chorismate mutase type II [FCB group bacterium]
MLKTDMMTIRGNRADSKIIIAGPCSAETEMQTIKTARELSKIGIKIFRAGIWKPRTRPGNYEGAKSAGLPWLKRVKKETGMLVCTEVATPLHVFEALKYGIDMLWLGARTTANPFAVQEIADAIKGVDLPIFIKNPINPDLELWIGAVERIRSAGITQLAVIHRGFSTYRKYKYRNDPHWQLPLELKRRYPDLTILSDPSHISGRRSLISEVSQQAMDLDFDGLMIETHINPDEALSDARQQITPNRLREILESLIIRKPGESIKNHLTLEKLRSEIDQMDAELLELLGKRMSVSDKMGLYKKENNLTIFQPQRYSEIMSERSQEGLSKGLSSEFTEKLFKSIHEESIRHQETIMTKRSRSAKGSGRNK